MVEGEGRGGIREGAREEALIDGVLLKAGEEEVGIAVHAEFDGIGGEERDECLVGEVVEVGIGPGEGGRVGDVDEGHAGAGMEGSGAALGSRECVGEGEFLAMAGGAGLLQVDGESGVVEEVSTEFDLGCGHGVVGGDVGRGEARPELPVAEGPLGGEGKGRAEE